MRELAIYSTEEYERNIHAVYRRATDADIVTGREWYRVAHETARTIARGDIKRGAGILAAFSPQKNWKLNVEIAARSIESNRFTGNFSANNRKARKIWDGKEPEKVLGGDKVRAFYENILHAGKTDAVCVDRHAFDVAIGYAQTEEQRYFNRLTVKKYRTIAQAYRSVARRNGLTGSELQAIVWVAWRREKGITE